MKNIRMSLQVNEEKWVSIPFAIRTPAPQTDSGGGRLLGLARETCQSRCEMGQL